jgi:hypothetical protein
VSLRQLAVFAGAMLASLLPVRVWPRLPPSFSMTSAAFASGLVTFFLGAAVGIPGFLEHAHAMTSLGLDAELHSVFTNPDAGYRQGMVQGFAGLSIFTFLLLTPRGWLTLYLIVGGGLRMGAAWFDDPIGDPILTGADALATAGLSRARREAALASREAREGPEIPDRVVSSSAAGIAGCDLVVVSSRRKPGWERGAAVYTQDAVYRIGEPVEQTIAGRLRTLYPLTEHRDFEVIRKSVRYELPPRADDPR